MQLHNIRFQRSRCKQSADRSRQKDTSNHSNRYHYCKHIIRVEHCIKVHKTRVALRASKRVLHKGQRCNFIKLTN